MSEESKEFILAYCGLVCTECGAYLKGKCGGCHSDKPLNFGCKVKPCAQEKNCTTCAGCVDFEDLKDCKKLNNFISRIFGFVFRTDRIGNLNRIKDIGAENFEQEKQT